MYSCLHGAIITRLIYIQVFGNVLTDIQLKGCLSASIEYIPRSSVPMNSKHGWIEIGGILSGFRVIVMLWPCIRKCRVGFKPIVNLRQPPKTNLQRWQMGGLRLMLKSTTLWS